MRLARGFWFSTVLVLTLAVLPATLFAAKPGTIADTSISSAAIEWRASGSYDRLVLTVSGPNDFMVTREFALGATPTLKLQDLGVKTPADGSYNWELRMVPRISAEVKQKLTEAREANDDEAVARIQAEAGLNRQMVQSGTFSIQGGAFVPSAEEPRPKANISSNAKTLKPAVNDQVIADDLIVQGSECVGLDCVNNESFGFDTIRLKENNTRIRFFDTSTSTGFPNHNWQLTANDSASGGANKFSIEDLTAATVPVTVTGSSPTNSVFVASNGKVGFRTSTPALDLHISTGDTPAIRQEQTTSGGFTAQTWDIGANEANWFVRDVTGGSRLPLRIRPGAPTSSIDISATGNIGINTASPQVLLDVRGASATADIFQAIGIDPTNGPSFNLGYSGASFGRGSGFLNVRPDAMAVAPNPSIRFLIANTQKMILNNLGFLGLNVANPGNPIEHSSGAILTAAGVWQSVSSREAKQDITNLPVSEAMAALEQLQPVKFVYKVDPTDHQVGFIAEDVPDLVATPNRKTLNPLEIVAVLTGVVKEQQQTIEQLKQRLADLETKQSKQQ
jgi:hypothetical protein